MGLMDKAKQAVQGKSDKIEKGIDAAAKQIDKRTGGKYADKLAQGADKVKARARELDEQRSGGGQAAEGTGQGFPDQRSGPADGTDVPRGGDSPTDPGTGGTTPRP